jgi:hypothetical protein
VTGSAALRHEPLQEESWSSIWLLSPPRHDPSAETEEMYRDIDALNEVLITDGPYLETTEHVGCFWCWKPLTRTRRLPGGARPQLPVGHRLRHASFNCRMTLRKS